jgi:hypothetical protein
MVIVIGRRRDELDAKASYHACMCFNIFKALKN